MADEPKGWGEIILIHLGGIKEDVTEIKAELKQFVPKDYFNEAIRSRDERLTRLEEDSKQAKLEKKSDRNLLKTSLYGASGSFLVGLALAIVAIVFGMK